MADHTFTQETQDSQTVQGPSMDLSPISLTGLIDMYDAFKGQMNVIEGIMNRPRCFEDETGAYAALEKQIESMSDLLCDVGNEVMGRRPTDAGELEAQAFLLFRYSEERGESITDALTIVTSALAVKH